MTKKELEMRAKEIVEQIRRRDREIEEARRRGEEVVLTPLEQAVEEMQEAIRRSQRITAEDLRITINCRADDL